MRYSLRTLLIVMLLTGPLAAYGWSRWSAYVEWKAQEEARRKIPIPPPPQWLPVAKQLYYREGALPKFRETPEETAEFEQKQQARRDF